MNIVMPHLFFIVNYTRRERLELAGSKMGGAYSLWEHWSEDEKKFHFTDVLKVNRSFLYQLRSCVVRGFLLPHHLSNAS